MTVEKALHLKSVAMLDAEVLLEFVLKKSRAFLFANPKKKLTAIQENKFRKLIRMRKQNWPVAYLVGHKEFFGFDFKVTPDVLIPRPETELLVELALSRITNKKFRIKNIIDIGTGSGNVIISIVKKLVSSSPKKQILSFLATDISKKALRIAKINAGKHGVYKKIEFLHSNLLGDLLPDSKFVIRNSILLANLPYGWKEWKNNSCAETQALKFEPQNALFAKERGVFLIRQLLAQIEKYSFQNSILLLEHDPRQKTVLRKLTKKYLPLADIKFHKDLSGRWRVLELRLAD